MRQEEMEERELEPLAPEERQFSVVDGVIYGCFYAIGGFRHYMRLDPADGAAIPEDLEGVFTPREELPRSPSRPALSPERGRSRSQSLLAALALDCLRAAPGMAVSALVGLFIAISLVWLGFRPGTWAGPMMLGVTIGYGVPVFLKYLSDLRKAL